MLGRIAAPACGLVRNDAAAERAVEDAGLYECPTTQEAGTPWRHRLHHGIAATYQV